MKTLLATFALVAVLATAPSALTSSDSIPLSEVVSLAMPEATTETAILKPPANPVPDAVSFDMQNVQQKRGAQPKAVPFTRFTRDEAVCQPPVLHGATLALNGYWVMQDFGTVSILHQPSTGNIAILHVSVDEASGLFKACLTSIGNPNLAPPVVPKKDG